MLGKRHNEIVSRLDKLERQVKLQGDAHSALMNQMGALHAAVAEGFKKLQERFSFTNRPRP